MAMRTSSAPMATASSAPERARWPLLAALALLGLAGLALGFFITQGWPGAPHPCFTRGNCYCEATGLLPVGAPGIQQPVNFWSNLAFSVVGLGMAWELWGPRPPDPSRALGPHTLGVYAVAVVFLGPASMAFHGSMTWWGGLVDNLSMYGFVGFLLVNTLTRHHPAREERFTPLYVGLCLGLLGLNALDVPGPWLVAACVAPLLALEGWALARRQLQVEARWFGLGLGAFAGAMAAWLPSGDGGPLCDPLSPWQGHALWHTLCAGAAWCLWRYLRSEARAR